MSLSGFTQLVLGFLFGVALLVAGAAGAAFLYLNTMADNPPRPTYAEEKEEKEEKEPEQVAQQTTVSSPEPVAESEPEPTDSEETQLPSGAYMARVIWSEGLSLRDEPDLEAERIGGVGYNWEILILEETSNNEWQKIRIPSSGQEGWVKAGNVEKIEEETISNN